MSIVYYNGGIVNIPWSVNSKFPTGKCPCCKEYSLYAIPSGVVCVFCSGLEIKPLPVDEVMKVEEWLSEQEESE